MEDDLWKLKSGPSPDEIEIIVNNYLSKKYELQQQLQFINTLLKEIVIVYKNLKSPLKLLIRRVFYTSIGISNLLNFYKLTKNDIYLKLTKDILLDPTFLSDIISSCGLNKMQMTQIRSLIVGSKIFQTFEGKLELSNYLQLVSKQFIETSKIGTHDISDFINPFLSLHPIEAKDIFFDNFFTDQYFQYVVQYYAQMNQIQQKQFLWRSLIPYLDPKTTVSNTDTIAKIMHKFEFSKFEDFILKKIAELSNIEFQGAISLLFKDHRAQFINLLQLWGNEQFINDTPFQNQEYMTKELLVLLNSISREERSSISKEKLFLDAITSRISTNDSPKRNLGLIVANKVTNNEIAFDIIDEILVEKLETPDLNSKIDLSDLVISRPLQNLSISSRKETKIADSDDESDSEEEENTSNETLFLKDLIKQFNDDKTGNITRLLTHTIKLVRQKTTFKLEIEFYSEELISILVGLINKYDEEDFEQLKINAIVSVIVTNTKIVSHVMNLLFTGDYSIQQRMIILSSISLAARELRGLDDEFIEKPQSDFPTRKIEQRHRPMVQEIEDKNSMKIEDKNSMKIEELRDDDDTNGLIGQGKVTRISKKLTTPDGKSKPNNFSKLAPKFFYPLANGWVQGIDVGTYNQMFLKHYLQTLELVIKAAYPCHEFDDMYELYNTILDNSNNIVI